jgi:serralysin
MPNIIESADAAASSSTTYVLGLGQTARGQLATGADHDWFAVSLTAGQTYAFAMTGTGTNNVLDTYLRLYGTNGTTLLAQNDDGLEGNNSVITFTPSASGVYYLDAGSYNNLYAGQYGVSFSLGNKASFDTEMGAGVMDSDLAWGTTITYGFRQTAAPYTVPGSNIATFTQLTAAEIAAVQAIMQYYSELTGITFTQVNPGGYTNNATILFANYNDPSDGAGAFAFFPGSTASTAQAGDVWLNTASVSTTSLPVGSYSFFAIMHEVGHALGLSHPGLYNAAPGVSITYANHAQFIQDTQQYTVMSYFDEANTGAGDYNSYADTPMLFDVYALQRIYGANTATRTGNTTYGFGSTAGVVYDFSVNTSPALCIWDAGGTDTLNCSGFAQNQTINLAEGGFSSIGGIAMNVSIALGAIIENAVGGSGGDTIHGNGVANTLSGGGGNDIVLGGAGDDLQWGDAGDDTFFGEPGMDQIDGGAGIDVVSYGGLVAGATVYLDRSLPNAGAAAGDRLYGIENVYGSATAGDQLFGDAGANRLTGLGGNDRLEGRAGNDTLTGGEGDDTLVGGAGLDRLVGNAGADKFVFDQKPILNQYDRVLDFDPAADEIDISASAFGGGLTAGGAVPFVSAIVPQSTGFTSGVLLYGTTTGYLSWDADGQGAGESILFAIITGPAPPTAADFVIIG